MGPLTAKAGFRLAVTVVLILLGIVSGLTATGVFFFLFFYPGYRTEQFHRESCSIPVLCEIELDRGGSTLSIKDVAWLNSLTSCFIGAVYFRPDHPRRESEYYVRVIRKSSMTDEYLFFLDKRGDDYDYVSVVHRSGNSTRYGSAFRVPGLRKLLDDPILK